MSINLSVSVVIVLSSARGLSSQLLLWWKLREVWTKFQYFMIYAISGRRLTNQKFHLLVLIDSRSLSLVYKLSWGLYKAATIHTLPAVPTSAVFEAENKNVDVHNCDQCPPQSPAHSLCHPPQRKLRVLKAKNVFAVHPSESPARGSSRVAIIMMIAPAGAPSVYDVQSWGGGWAVWQTD